MSLHESPAAIEVLRAVDRFRLTPGVRLNCGEESPLEALSARIGEHEIKGVQSVCFSMTPPVSPIGSTQSVELSLGKPEQQWLRFDFVPTLLVQLELVEPVREAFEWEALTRELQHRDLLRRRDESLRSLVPLMPMRYLTARGTPVAIWVTWCCTGDKSNMIAYHRGDWPGNEPNRQRDDCPEACWQLTANGLKLLDEAAGMEVELNDSLTRKGTARAASSHDAPVSSAEDGKLTNGEAARLYADLAGTEPNKPWIGRKLTSLGLHFWTEHDVVQLTRHSRARSRRAGTIAKIGRFKCMACGERCSRLLGAAKECHACFLRRHGL